MAWDKCPASRPIRMQRDKPTRGQCASASASRAAPTRSPRVCRAAAASMPHDATVMSRMVHVQCVILYDESYTYGVWIAQCVISYDESYTYGVWIVQCVISYDESCVYGEWIVQRIETSS